jgi:hypothetical protein
VEEVFFILAQDGATCPRGWSKIVFLPYLRKYPTFFNLFFALVLCYQHANLMEEKFLKNQSRLLKQKIKNNPPTTIFSKTFLPLNLRAENTKLMQKID